MIGAVHEVERREWRVLGALQFVDATTGAPIDTPLQLQSHTPPGEIVKWQRNRSGSYVLREWSRLAAHAQAFDSPPAPPAIGSMTLDCSVDDPAGDYLPRSFATAWPRDPDPAHRSNAASLFSAERVELMRSARAAIGANWARLSVRVADSASDDALGGALVEVRTTGGALLGRGLTEWTGEALLPIAGIPVTTWSEGGGAVVVSETPARVVAFFLAAAGVRTPRAVADAGFGAQPPALAPVDPDRIAADPAVHASAPIDLALAAGRSRAVRIDINLP